MGPILFSMPGNEAFTGLLATHLQCETGGIEVRRFPDGESYIRLRTLVVGRKVVFVCTLDRPDEKIAALYLATSVTRELGAASIGLVAPYLAYMRQDARFQEGEGVTSAHFARLISGLCDWLVTVDPHLHRHHDLTEIYSIPTRVVHAAPLIAQWITQTIGRPVVVGPDSESAQWVAEVADAAGCLHTVLEKTRRGDRDVEVSIPKTDDWQGMTPVLVDDIVSTARTMAAAAAHLNAAGFSHPVCISVHPLFADDAYAVLQRAGVDIVASCNTVAHFTNQIDISEPVALAMSEFVCG